MHANCDVMTGCSSELPSLFYVPVGSPRPMTLNKEFAVNNGLNESSGLVEQIVNIVEGENVKQFSSTLKRGLSKEATSVFSCVMFLSVPSKMIYRGGDDNNNNNNNIFDS